jgi:hypothetical protein
MRPGLQERWKEAEELWDAVNWEELDTIWQHRFWDLVKFVDTYRRMPRAAFPRSDCDATGRRLPETEQEYQLGRWWPDHPAVPVLGMDMFLSHVS